MGDIPTWILKPAAVAAVAPRSGPHLSPTWGVVAASPQPTRAHNAEAHATGEDKQTNHKLSLGPELEPGGYGPHAFGTSSY